MLGNHEEEKGTGGRKPRFQALPATWQGCPSEPLRPREEVGRRSSPQRAGGLSRRRVQEKEA